MTEPDPREAIESAIDAAIAAVGGKQADLAEKLACAQQTVSKLRSGEIPMTADWALRLHGATGIPAPAFCPALAAIAQPGDAVALLVAEICRRHAMRNVKIVARR